MREPNGLLAASRELSTRQLLAAYQRGIRYITTNNVWGTYPSLNDSRTDADCYDIQVNSSSGSWERYFYFGGPGFWAHGQ